MGVQMNIGYVRVGAYVLIPMVFTLLCVILFNSIVHKFERDEKQKIKDKLQSTKDEVKAVKAVGNWRAGALKAAANKGAKKGSKTSKYGAGVEFNSMSPTPQP